MLPYENQRFLGAILSFALAACSSDPAPDPDPDHNDDGNEPGAAEKAFTAFESGQVRPLALSPDGAYLYVTNTPGASLEIYAIKAGGLDLVASVPVGLEPVAVAARDYQVWVVNHVSDSVSIVDVSEPTAAHVERTLLVGDEPRDIVFAGPGRRRAFVTTAHRGQNTRRDPQLTTPGVGRADVWVFDAEALGASLEGDPLTVVTLFADTPRALAVSTDGATVYAAAFHSGNRTTTVPERLVTTTAELPPPRLNATEQPQPNTAIIVKQRPDPGDGGAIHWVDSVGRRWDDQVKFNLPDQDVFAIDATANPPVQRAGGVHTGVGTTLFNMVVNPRSGRIYVSNTDAHNDIRFEGHNQSGPDHGGAAGSVRGHIADNRITVLDPAGGVTPRQLNKHIDYDAEGTPAEAALSLAFPTEMVVSADGDDLYVAALGSSKVGVLSTAELEADSFVPSAASQITVTGGGPTGLALDEPRHALYVHTRFDNGISIIDTATRREIAHVTMDNPEPESIIRGRRFLYDAALTSGHGDSACASCHMFGDLDALAWDLGDPDAVDQAMPGPFAVDPAFITALGYPPPMFQALKGPMSTQSLRGMDNHGPMHWRGDRTGGTDVEPGASAQPDTGTFDEVAAFAKFNVAFPGLLGRTTELSADDMEAFGDFILQVTYPPNPIRNLDNSLTPLQQIGFDFYNQTDADGNELPVDRVHNCNGCHRLDRDGNAEFGVAHPGFFGTEGITSFPQEPQWLKIPQLRNLYQKVGMFGIAAGFNPADVTWTVALPPPYNDESFTGDQVRGFGYLHDGQTDTLFRLHSADSFARGPAIGPFAANPGGFPIITDPTNAEQAAQELAENFALRRAIEAFLLAYDSNLAPIVGQQATFSANAGGDVVDRIELLLARAAAGECDVVDRIELLLARAAAGECDVVVHGLAGNRIAGRLYDPATKKFVPDTAAGKQLSVAAVRALGKNAAITFTAVPPGTGHRIALDRDRDGTLDGDQ